MNKSGHGVIQSEETLLLLVCSTMLLENRKVLRVGKINSATRKVTRKVRGHSTTTWTRRGGGGQQKVHACPPRGGLDVHVD